jgi:hypothetical protein
MENKILELFLFKNELKFSEIEKLLKTRSNKLAYHLKNLQEKGILMKNKDKYSLSEIAEHQIPYITNKKVIIPIVLIKIGKDNKIFLINREKRPFKGYLALPGGRLMLGESIKSAAIRIMKEKHNIKIQFKEIKNISIESVIKNEKIIHSFLIILISATLKEKINLIDINKHKDQIISSDYTLIKNNKNEKIIINYLKTKIKE